jgi:cytoskeletal protein CcmA (bactofilin family)
MASTYVNDLRLEEIGTGDQSGSWGTTTNTNLELIAEAFSYGTEAIANASTHTITVADGTSDEARSLYLKCTGGGQACTVTIAPNTLSKVWIIENATSYTLTFSQGTGANVAVLASQVKMIATDGAGGGAVVYDLLTDVNLAGTTVYSALNDGTTTLTSTVAELNILDGVTATAAELNILDGVTSTAAELNYNDTGSAVGTVVASKTVTVDANKDVASFRNITLTGELDAGSLDVSGDADIDGTLETDALSINGTTVTSTAAELNILDGVTSTAAELNLVDGITAGTVAASKAVIVDSNKDITGYRNLTATATITGAEVTATSDVRLKSNIETINGALDKVKAMRGVYFDKNDKRSVGVIAQEMQEVMPEVVVTDDTEDKHLSVAYGNLVGVLIEAVKELSEEVSELRNNVQTIRFEDS